LRLSRIRKKKYALILQGSNGFAMLALRKSQMRHVQAAIRCRRVDANQLISAAAKSAAVEIDSNNYRYQIF
jgi:hypothetical protein